MGPRARFAAGRDERGAILIWLTFGGLFVIVFIIGVVHDAVGLGLSTRERAADLAAQAARTGAIQVSEASMRTGNPTDLHVDMSAAKAAVQRLMVATGARGDINPSGPTTVRATVTVQHRTAVLCLFGYDTVSATVSSSATILYGVRTGTGTGTR